MKNIFVEGLQGAGKSTLVSTLAAEFPQLRVCREGEYSPVELAWCAWMTRDEYAAMLARYKLLEEEIVRNTQREGEACIVTYTKIRTDDRSVYKAFENYEIYNGRKPLEALKEIIFRRYAGYKGRNGLFECAFFQNIMEELMLYHQLNDDEIVAFYCDLWNVVDKENFQMVYLYSDRIEENIRVIRKERLDGQGNEAWYEMMLDFLTKCPYGRTHGYATFEDMASHFEHRQQLEMRIIGEVIGEKAIVLPAKGYVLDSISAYIEE